jgi:hypothetical protein
VKTNPTSPAACVAVPEGSWHGPPIALFWDQSLVWGLICLQTLQQLQVPVRLISAAEIDQGVLDAHRVLLVPGGWATHKMQALGKAGQDRVRQFVTSGGSYLGFCGGAGLALSSPPSLGLVALQRMPIKERLPSASGPVVLTGDCDHPIWQAFPVQLMASVWWPSQFRWETTPSVRVLASYAALANGFWLADLPLADLESPDMSYSSWEQAYGINLNPARLLGQPAIIEASLGQGRLILSYPHLETPGDTQAHRLLVKILRYLDTSAALHLPKVSTAPPRPQRKQLPPGTLTLDCLQQAAAAVDDLIAFGQRHLLWNWRLPWLLHWRRGIRGLEYGTLAVMTRVVVQETERLGNLFQESDDNPWLLSARALLEETGTFCQLARKLLLEEKLAGQNGTCAKLGQVNATVDQLRSHLFGTQMNHGGRCRTLLDRLDRLLYLLLTFSALTNMGYRPGGILL